MVINLKQKKIHFDLRFILTYNIYVCYIEHGVFFTDIYGGLPITHNPLFLKEVEKVLVDINQRKAIEIILNYDRIPSNNFTR